VAARATAARRLLVDAGVRDALGFPATRARVADRLPDATDLPAAPFRLPEAAGLLAGVDDAALAERPSAGRAVVAAARVPLACARLRGAIDVAAVRVGAARRVADFGLGRVADRDGVRLVFTGG
jgi:hypothetical protein